MQSSAKGLWYVRDFISCRHVHHLASSRIGKGRPRLSERPGVRGRPSLFREKQ
jgi:hypothetical protein